MVNYNSAKLVEYVRDGLVEQEHLGIILHCLSDGSVKKVGDDKSYPFYLRSCAKPLQTSLIIDFGLDEFYDMTLEEIAICCASHAGEQIHIKTAKGLLEKIGLDESYLKCGLHKPISKTEQNKLVLSGESENVLQNNCSGKHVMMLAICKKMCWSLNNYDDINHPLQIAIKKKIYELCEILPPTPALPLKGGGSNAPTQDLISQNMNLENQISHYSPSPLEGEGWGGGYPITKDGCGVPIFSMPLENMVKGYMNLFLDEKYSKLRDAFVQNPYLIGGEDRLDTAVMQSANRCIDWHFAKCKMQNVDLLTSQTTHLIAKVGAGGLCIVINLEKREGLIVKIMDCDMKARAICLIEALRQLGWLTEEMLKNDLIKAQNKKDILTLHGEKIGEAKITYNFK